MTAYHILRLAYSGKPACNDNVSRHATTMYAGMQRQCMLACNDNVCWHAMTMYAGMQ
ncbi:MAG: hypothetical protein LBS54_08505 [Dysgonamonadaceae bacterium]|nr:hypothetical protein [Dysgonamonadaceae bacterium]